MVFISGWIVFVSGIHGNVFKVIHGTWGRKSSATQTGLFLRTARKSKCRLGLDGLLIPLLSANHYKHKPAHGGKDADALSATAEAHCPWECQVDLPNHVGHPLG